MQNKAKTESNHKAPAATSTALKPLPLDIPGCKNQSPADQLQTIGLGAPGAGFRDLFMKAGQ